MPFYENITYFDRSEGTFAWRDTRIARIEERRALLSDMLLFDTLLSLGGIKEPETLYPPADVPALERLLDAIENSQYDRLKRDCLIYYLLACHEDNREVNFESERAILPQFAALAKAYWHIDNGVQLPVAVSLLSDARLNKDYSSKILSALSQDPDEASQLVLMYVITAKPPLTEPEDVTIYMNALLESNFLHAWRYQRSFSELDPIRPKLLRQIFNWCVTPTPRAAPLEQLLGLCLSSWEQSQLQAHVLDPEATIPHTNLSFLQTLVCVRLIQGGRYAEAIKMDRLISSQPALKSHSAERAQMMQELYATLSPTERVLLDVELEPTFTQDAEPKSASSMSQSWVDIRISPPRTTKTNGVSSVPMSTPSRTTSFPLPRLNMSASKPAQDPVAALFNSTPARGSPAPIIPLSSVNRSAPRKSGPLFANLPNTPSAFSKPPPQSTPSFDSAARKSNAFYQPPVSQNTSSPFSASTPTWTNVNAVNGHDADVEMDDGDVRHEDANGSGSLGFSIFSGPSAASRTADRPSPSAAAPPGALAMDDDEQDSDVAMNEQSPPPPPPTRQARQTRSRASVSAQSQSSKPKPTTRKTRGTKEKQKEKDDSEFRSSIPGSFAMTDDDEEVEDTVAPLPPSAATRGVRRSRASAALSDASTDDGDESRAATRRRSSRLSTATAESGSAAKKASSTAKPKRTTTGRKKR